jgi:hypothetical protein
MEDDFYNKPFHFSYSSLNKLLWNPQAFYQMYVLGNREEKTESYLVNGKIIHALLLEPEKFDDQFVISPDNLPTGNVRVVIDRVFAHHQELSKNGDTRIELSDFDGAILDVMRDMNYYQNLKTDQQRLDKIITNEYTGYWNFLRSKGSKTLISQDDLNFCKTAVDIIKLNKNVCDLIGSNVTEFSNKEVFNEIALSVQINDRPFGLKGIIDNLVVDHNDKVIYINDIKTTSKDLKDFPESIDFYNYWLQAAIYTSIIATKFINLIEQGYIMKFHFVVIDKNYQVYPFEVTPATLESWFNKLMDSLEKAHWHFVNKSYDLPYDFAIGKVTL